LSQELLTASAVKIQDCRVASVVRPFRGVSAEDRLARRRADLLEAGLDEVAAVGVANLRMRSVCDRAGLIHRYFYEHFKNREELLEALFASMMTDMRIRTAEAVTAQPLDLMARARAALTVFLDCFVEERHARLYAEAASTPALATLKTAAIRRYVDHAVDQVEAVYGKTDKHTRDRVALAALVVCTGQAEAALAWHAGDVPLNRDEYVDTVARVFVTAMLTARNQES
jgi:AcrR family transcriptional regulator